jgi:hypothetical protein
MIIFSPGKRKVLMAVKISRSMAWVTSALLRLALKHWLKEFSLPLLTLKKQGHLAVKF